MNGDSCFLPFIGFQSKAFLKLSFQVSITSVSDTPAKTPVFVKLYITRISLELLEF